MGLFSWLSTLLTHGFHRSTKSGDDSAGPGVRRSAAVESYFTDFLPGFQGQALVPGLSGISASIRFSVGQPERELVWDVTLESGCISSIQPGGERSPEIEYQVSEKTFLLVTAGRLRAERAFLMGKVKVRGSVLKGLKMAALLQGFFDRFPYSSGSELEGEVESGAPGDPPPPSYGASVFHVDATEGDEDLCEEQFILSEGDTELDLRLTYPVQGTCPWHVILVPPHPLLGATPDNEVLRFIARDLALRRCLVIRFGYSFGAASASTPLTAIQTFWDTSDTENDLGLQDLMRVWDWLKRQPFSPDVGVALAGYSYGAQLVLKSLRWIHPEKEVLISPVVSQLGEEIQRVSTRLLLVTADEDFASTREESRCLAESLPVRPVWVPLPEADHFYRGKMEPLARAICEFLGLTPGESSGC